MEDDALDTRRCSATAKASGERCGRAPIPGGNVCAVHGGKAPQVVEMARMRLMEGASLAIDALLRCLTPTPPCPMCGRSDSDRDPATIRAAQIVLDRTGFGASAKLEVTPSETTITRIERIIVYPDGTRKQLDVPAVEGYLIPEPDDEDPPVSSVHHETAQFPSGTSTPPPNEEEPKP